MDTEKTKKIDTNSPKASTGSYMRKPNLDMSIFKNRRELLKEKLKSLSTSPALILTSHPECLRNHDVHFPYRQDSNFFYLSGFEEPESVIVFRPGLTPEFTMFVRPRDPLRETWDGFRYGPELTEKYFGADKCYLIDELERVLPALLKDADRVYYRMFHNHDSDKHIQSALEKLKLNQGRSGVGLLPIHDSSEILGEMRLIKQTEEVEWLKKACHITSQAHINAMRFTKPSVNESEVQAVLEFNFRMGGSLRNGYNSIVATGANATTLHYNFNDQECQDGDLILIDAGAEYNYYTSDITRTFPVNGKFNRVQKDFYERVLKVQKTIIEMVRPGLEFKKLQDTAITLLTEHMLELGLLKGVLSWNIEQGNFRKYYPHGVSHWLGMDVHDVGLYKKGNTSRVLEPGMCFTVEPGLYIPYDDTDAPKELRGLGVRIEDNILVTETGYENLTRSCPKEVNEIEAIVGKGAN